MRGQKARERAAAFQSHQIALEQVSEQDRVAVERVVVAQDGDGVFRLAGLWGTPAPAAEQKK